ncbi:MAG: M28 family peptidase [Gemmatimonadaceae bacterium]
MDVRALLNEIGSVGRPAGSSAESAARMVCTAWLKSAGFEATEHAFEYSAFPGRWGMPVTGSALFLIGGVGAAVIAADPGNVNVAMRYAILMLSVVLAAGWWMGRYGTRLVPLMRRRGLNLEARRGVPKVWLIAHLDSKSQPLSLLVRAIGSVGLACGWILAIAAWAAVNVLQLPSEIEVVLLALSAAAALSLAFAWIGEAGSGALDNASGVASILGAVTLLDSATPVGIVVTSAEELGLAGARTWVAGRLPCVAINCDGVDDDGPVTITASGRGRRVWKKLAMSVGLASSVRFKRILPGVLLDASAFSESGWVACTVSKGARGSLARIHTRRDTVAALSGSGVEEVQKIIASIAGAMVERRNAPECRNGGLP